MPIYCYKCDDCGYKWESFTHISVKQDSECPECGNLSIYRNYVAERKVVFSDVPPHYDFGIGQWINGRRDRYSKYKQLGLRPLTGARAGDSVKPYKEYYGDELGYDMTKSRRNPIDERLDQAQASGEVDNAETL